MHISFKKIYLFRTPYLFPLGWAVIFLVAAIIGIMIGTAISNDCLRLRGVL